LVVGLGCSKGWAQDPNTEDPPAVQPLAQPAVQPPAVQPPPAPVAPAANTTKPADAEAAAPSAEEDQGPASLSGLFITKYVQVDFDYRPSLVLYEGSTRSIGTLTSDFYGARFIPFASSKWGDVFSVAGYVSGFVSSQTRDSAVPVAGVLALELCKSISFGGATKIWKPENSNKATADFALVLSLSLKNRNPLARSVAKFAGGWWGLVIGDVTVDPGRA